MALDKIVDSTELDNGLTTIANAIRTKGGTSEQLSFPSGMADAIAAIPSGGGSLPTSISKVAGGTMTFATNQSSDSFYEAARMYHNFGVLPKGFIVWCPQADFSVMNDNQIAMGYALRYVLDNGETLFAFLQQCSAYNGSINKYSRSIPTTSSGFMTEEYCSYNIANNAYRGGYTYFWFAWA